MKCENFQRWKDKKWESHEDNEAKEKNGNHDQKSTVQTGDRPLLQIQIFIATT